ncbi:MAG: response regulator transcription factor [Clostridia bacterium]|jgi:DNA-binding LytR/AlgR family response regulator|nr:response regulator transcription factor [Clostridia bacterium]
MIRIAIVEDEKIEHERIRECLDFVSEREKIEFDISDFYSAPSFLCDYEPIYDIVLMDIEMPEMNGMEAAKKLRVIDQTVILLFVTNMAQYAVSGYEVDALDFIVKPIEKYHFALKMSRAVSRTTRRTEREIIVDGEGEVLSISLPQIVYLEVIGHYVYWHISGDRVVKEYSTMKNAENRILRGGANFVKCNRCYLVNLRYVEAVKKDTVIIGKDRLSISRPQRKAFLNAFVKYIGGNC